MGLRGNASLDGQLLKALAMAAVLHVGDINARALAYAAWAFATLGRSVDQLLESVSEGSGAARWWLICRIRPTRHGRLQHGASAMNST